MLSRESVETEQHIDIVGDLGSSFRPLRPVLGGERLRGLHCLRIVFSVVDLGRLRARMSRFRWRPGNQICCGQNDFGPGGIGVKAWQGRLARPAALASRTWVLDARVGDGAVSGRRVALEPPWVRVGDEGSHPSAVGVGEAQLRPRLPAFVAQDQPGPGRPSGQVDRAGGLGHPRRVASATHASSRI